MKFEAARRAAIPVCLATACIGPNPEFIEARGDAGAQTDTGLETGDEHPGGGNADGNGSMDETGSEFELVVTVEDLPDTYVDALAPQQNFGAAPTLRVDGEREAYVDLPNIGVLEFDGDLRSVTLVLTATQAGAPVELYEVEEPWSEHELTAATAPATVGEPLTSFEPAPGVNLVELPIGSSPWSFFDYGRGVVLRSKPASEAGAEFESREGGTGPYLIVRVER